MPAGVMRQFLNRQDAVRSQGVNVQVALEKTATFWGEGQVVGNRHTFLCDLVSAEQDAPLPGHQVPGAVTGCGKRGADLDAGLVRAGGADLPAMRVDQTQVDDVDLLPGAEAISPRLADVVALVMVGQGEGLGVRRHAEREREVSALAFVPDKIFDVQRVIDEIISLVRDRTQNG